MSNCPNTVALISSHILCSGYPALRFSGQIVNHSYIVTDLLGSSLHDLVSDFKNKFSIKTICHIGYQLVCCPS
jgi:hypothetical protein